MTFKLHLFWWHCILNWRLHSLKWWEFWHRWFSKSFIPKDTYVAIPWRHLLLGFDSTQDAFILWCVGIVFLWRNACFFLRPWRSVNLRLVVLIFGNNWSLRQVLDSLNSLIHFLDLVVWGICSVRRFDQFEQTAILPRRFNSFLHHSRICEQINNQLDIKVELAYIESVLTEFGYFTLSLIDKKLGTFNESLRLQNSNVLALGCWTDRDSCLWFFATHQRWSS